VFQRQDKDSPIPDANGWTPADPLTPMVQAASTAAPMLQLMVASQNLSDVANPAASRNNIGLGNAAVLNVGSTSGTVAAGDVVTALQARVAALEAALAALTASGVPAMLSADGTALLSPVDGAPLLSPTGT